MTNNRAGPARGDNPQGPAEEDRIMAIHKDGYECDVCGKVVGPYAPADFDEHGMLKNGYPVTRPGGVTVCPECQ